MSPEDHDNFNHEGCGCRSDNDCHSGCTPRNGGDAWGWIWVLLLASILIGLVIAGLSLESVQ